MKSNIRRKRVLISSIGGGKTEKAEGVKILKKYENTTYTIKKESGEYYDEKTSYMPSVIENNYGIDKTIIIGTTGSMWGNTYEQYCKKYNKNKDDKYKNYLTEIQIKSDKNTSIKDIDLEKFNKEFEGNVKGIVINYGLNKKEIFENFDLIIKLEEEFNESEEYLYEVYLDITHSFRSMAFWMFLVMNYLRDISNKNIKIAGITYGMFEAKDHQDDKTPIVLLEPFSEILSWIKGASELKQYGNSYYILDNLNDSSIDDEIKNELENFSNAMNMNYIASLLKSIDKLKNLEDRIELISGPAKHIIPDILKKFIKDFAFTENNISKKDYLLRAILAKWHFSQKRYAMTAVNINEALVNFIANALGLKNIENKFDPNMTAKNWLGEVKNKFEAEINLSSIEKKLKRYGEIYYDTRRIRNETAHSLGNETNMQADIKILKEFSNEIIELLKEENFIKSVENKFKFLEKITPNKNKETEKKEKVITYSKKILILSTKELGDKEIQELKDIWKFDALIHLPNKKVIAKWKTVKTEGELKKFKKIIDDYLIRGSLKENDYILIHSNLKIINKMKGYANTKKLNVIVFNDPYSSNDRFFDEIF